MGGTIYDECEVMVVTDTGVTWSRQAFLSTSSDRLRMLLMCEAFGVAEEQVAILKIGETHLAAGEPYHHPADD